MLFPEISDPDFRAYAQFVGIVGVAIYVTGFFCLCTGRLTSQRTLYFVLTFTASSCVMISLFADFNLSAALIQGFYVMASTIGIATRLRRWSLT